MTALAEPVTVTPCPICGGTRTAAEHCPDWVVWVCATCGLVSRERPQ